MQHIPKPPLTQIPQDLVSLADYAHYAKAHMRPDIYEYISGGTGDEVTLQNNQNAFQRWQIVPRMLQDVTGAGTQVNLFGQTFRHPVLLAPVAFHKLVHEQGELATAEAVNALEASMCVSTLSSVDMETLGSTLTQPKIFQLYLQASRDFSLELVRRAERAGYCAIMVTVDASLHGIRNRAQRAGFVLPEVIRAENLIDRPELPTASFTPDQSIILQGMMSEAPTWADIEWLVSQTDLPVIIKGLLHPEDVKQAEAMGAKGVVVSNHGGRVLDQVPSALDMLPEIRATVSDDFMLLLDGGVSRGTDVLIAMALGANALMIGRPQLNALAVAGALGVAHMLRVLREEFEVALALAGVTDLSDIRQVALRRVQRT